MLIHDLLAAGLTSPLREHFLSGRYRAFEHLTQDSEDERIRLCRDYIHNYLAQAFLRDGAECCARIYRRIPFPSRPDEESLLFYGLRHHYRGQPLTLPVPPTAVPSDKAAYPGPYLAAPEPEVAAWARRLAAWPGEKIGLIWGPSLALQAFAGLPRRQYFGLQQGPHQIQALWPPEGMQFVDLSEFLEDWSCIAGLLHHLDLLISVDHPTAHLAGAMGRPVWVVGQTIGDYGPEVKHFATLKKLWTARYTRPRKPTRALGKRQDEHAPQKPQACPGAPSG